MEYYTLLTIYYPIAEYEVNFSIWFASEQSCWNILLDTNSIYDKVKGTSGFCDVSEIVSKIVKPKLRPW